MHSTCHYWVSYVWLWHYKVAISDWHESSRVKGGISGNTVVTSNLSSTSLSLRNLNHPVAPAALRVDWNRQAKDGYRDHIERLWKTKHLTLGFEKWKDLDIRRWKVNEKGLSYTETQKRLKICREHVQDLRTNRRIWYYTFLSQIFWISYSAKLSKGKSFLKERVSQTSLSKNH